MKLAIGIVVVLVCTFGGYVGIGGNLAVLYQPFELVIIGGTAVGAFIIANPGRLIRNVPAAFLKVNRGARYGKEDYAELLLMMYQTFRTAKYFGNLGLEKHIESPQESTLFQMFPRFHANDQAVEFWCDYLRAMSMGAEDPHAIEDIMEAELETKDQFNRQMSNALYEMAQGLPGLGIVAAVLGVIKTMGSITEPPEVLGQLIGGALVGTFLGVWLSYGFFGSFAMAVRSANDEDHKYFEAMKLGIKAHLDGQPPLVSMEFARKAVPEHSRPSFSELELRQSDLPSVSS
jgi:chemotaxis protein MotA